MGLHSFHPTHRLARFFLIKCSLYLFPHSTTFAHKNTFACWLWSLSTGQDFVVIQHESEHWHEMEARQKSELIHGTGENLGSQLVPLINESALNMLCYSSYQFFPSFLLVLFPPCHTLHQRGINSADEGRRSSVWSVSEARKRKEERDENSPIVYLASERVAGGCF